MDSKISELLEDTQSKNNKIRMNALNKLLDITKKPVNWFEEIKDDLYEHLKSENSYQRSIAMMLICNLAKNDENLAHAFLPNVLKLINDNKFITQRQTIQHIWKMAVSQNKLKKIIIEAMLSKYNQCLFEEHYNLIRQDIIQSLYTIHLQNTKECPLSMIQDLIEAEDDSKLKKKYLKLIEK